MFLPKPVGFTFSDSPSPHPVCVCVCLCVYTHILSHWLGLNHDNTENFHCWKELGFVPSCTDL